MENPVVGTLNTEDDTSTSESLVDRVIRVFLEVASDDDDANEHHQPLVLPQETQPPVIYNAEQVALIRIAAQEFVVVRRTSEDPRAARELSTLINHLFHRYFLTTYSSPPFLPSDPEPLLDCLLCWCEPDTWDTLHTRLSAFRFIVGLLVAVAEDARSQVDDNQSEDDKPAAFIGDFHTGLHQAWRWESMWRLQRTTHSPMPWSVRSRSEGIPYPPPDHFDHNAKEAVIPSDNIITDNQLFFPDILWLGGYHDGFCRSTTLSAYVWIRFSLAKTQRDYLALWQSAMTFGVLEAITGTRVPESLLLSPRPDGTSVITSKQVSLIISSWLFSDSSMAADDIPVLVRRTYYAHDVISSALRALSEETMYTNSGVLLASLLSPRELEDLKCNLSALLESFLPSVWLKMVQYQREGTNIEQANFAGSSSDFLGTIAHRVLADNRRLAENGWCPFTTSSLTTSVNLIGYALASRPFIRTSTSEHASCTRDRCLAHNIDPSDYTPQHAPTCPVSARQACHFLSPPIALVTDLLSAHQIPVLVFDGGGFTVRSAADGPYVAISHVWADGLGSTTEDGLPLCQILRIATYARELVPDGAFWVDALCVPQSRELRKRAILLMADTYRQADKVVVFDTSIRAFCDVGSPPTEVLFRIMTSAWMQRVWTLQEAMLARDLFFEVSDGLVPITTLERAHDRAMERVPSALGELPRALYLLDFMPDKLRLMFNKARGSASRRLRTTRTYSLANIADMLSHRTTQRAEDETVAIAGLMRIDAARLLAESGADARMRAFWRGMESLPASVVLSTSTSKLRYPGYRWASRKLSLLGSVTNDLGDAHWVSELGLTTDRPFTLILLPAVELGGSDAHPDAVVLVNPEGQAAYLFSALRGKAGDRTLTMNGLVAAPQVLNALTEGSITIAIAVQIASSDLVDVQTHPEAERIVVCEHLFYVGLRQLRSDLGSHADIEDVAKFFKAPTVEGKFTEVRITMT